MNNYTIDNAGPEEPKDPIPADEALRREGRLPSGEWPPSEKQVAYVRSIQKRLRLPERMLDDHCVKTFGRKFAELGKGKVSDLIDEMLGWEQIPAGLREAAGQRALPGLGTDAPKSHGEKTVGPPRTADGRIDFAKLATPGTPEEIAAARARMPAPAEQLATPRQLKFIRAVAREAGIDEGTLREEVERKYGKALPELTRRQASECIENLQARRGLSADLAS